MEESQELSPGDVKNILLVLSGKGGVGKSMTAARIAFSFHGKGHRVGVLDVDLCGPSVPRIFGVAGQPVHNCSQGWVPVFVDGESQRLCVMSIGFLLSSYENDAIVWRGPKKTGMVKQFVSDVVWGPLDWLIVDTPPGTSDEHITIVQTIQEQHPSANLSAVLVTTPQAVAVDDVRREVTFCRKTNVPIKGIIENMSGFVCPNCNECAKLFSKGGGEALANQMNLDFLGSIPIDPKLAASMDLGLNCPANMNTLSVSHIDSIVEKVLIAV